MGGDPMHVMMRPKKIRTTSDLQVVACESMSNLSAELRAMARYSLPLKKILFTVPTHAPK